MTILIGLLLMLGLAFGPGLWVKHVLARYSEPRDDFPGTGGELARHLLDEMKLDHVTVEQTKLGDHYDPEAKAVRLSPDHFGGRSLSAVAVAAHEVGHAMQDATDYAMLKRRTSMAKMTHVFEKIGGVVMLGAPLLAIVTRSPAVFAIEFFAGLALLGMSVVIHLITLPVEIDASFNRALKALETGRYLPEDDMPAVRKILWAAALTYVAAAMMSLLNVARWLRVLRF